MKRLSGFRDEVCKHAELHDDDEDRETALWENEWPE